MKNLLVSLFVMTFVCMGCAYESIDLEEGPQTYRASLEKYSQPTKVFMSKGLDVDWSMGDRIAVFEGSDTAKAYQLLGAAAGNGVGEFSLTDGTVIGESAQVQDTTIAVYPFDENISVSSDPEGRYEIRGLSFPTEYTYADPGTISYLPMVAVAPANNRNLSFKNTGSLIKVSLSGEYQVRSITVQGNANEAMAGEATIIIDSDGLPKVQISSDASNAVTVNYDPAVQLNSDDKTEFFIPVPPTRFTSGLMLMITDSEGNMFQTEIPGEAVVERSMLFEPSLSKEEIKEVCTIESVVECVVDINEDVTPLFSECDDIEQLASHIEEFRKFKGVVDVWRNNSSLYILTKSGLTLSWTYTPEECDETPSASIASVASVDDRRSTASISYDEHDTSHKYDKVCIVNQQYNDDNRRKYLAKYDMTETYFKDNGFKNVERIDGEEADLEFFTDSLTDYDIIFLVTHGNFDGQNHWIATGQEVDLFTEIEIEQELLEWNKGKEIAESKEFHGLCFDVIEECRYKSNTLIPVSIAYVGISQKYIAEKMKGRFNDAIIFNTACQSLKGNDGLASAFLGKGAKVYLGYDDDNEKGKEAGPAFFINMLKGMTVGEAYDALCEEHRNDPYNGGAHLNYTPEDGKDICIAHLIPITQDAITEDGKIRLNGTFKSPIKGYHEIRTMGFCYSDTTATPTVETGEVIYVENTDVTIEENIEYYAQVNDTKINTDYNYSFFFQNPHSKEYVYGDAKSFKTPDVEWVDLGLSVLWAAWNVGANSPEEYGGYYAWGETEEKSDHYYKAYKFYNPSTDEYDFIGSEISGTPYDVAHVKWGGGARMPTLEEMKELDDKCTIKQGTFNGVRGHYITGPNGNSIFLPNAGYKDEWGDTQLFEVSYTACIWSGTFHEGNKYGRTAHYLMNGHTSDFHYRNRRIGHTVRPVKNK